MKHPKHKEPEAKAVKVTEELLNEIVRKIVENFKVEKIILFGSYAWGKPREWSDIDLLIVMKTDLRPALQAAKIGCLFFPREIPMDFIALTPHDVKEKLSGGWPFYEKIFSKGKTLYDVNAA